MSAESLNSEVIRAQSCPECPVCRSSGAVVHQGVRDGSYGSPGVWSYKKCQGPACGALWLDPTPNRHDLIKAYRNYYTHARADTERKGVLKTIYRIPVHILLTVSGVLAERRRADSMFVENLRPGTLLDVGCGQGIFLRRMARLGWNVSGVDFDPDAVAAAREQCNLDVRIGGIDSVPGSAQFDVITASHVIEHVPNPVEFMRHCRRLLKPTGRLIIRTPNARSLGHRMYGRDWRGLEPPRHLCILTSDSVRLLANEAGFSVSECFTSHAMAESVLIVSRLLRKYGRFSPGERSPGRLIELKLLGPMMAVRARIAWTRDRDCGEEVCAVLRLNSASS